MSHPRTPKRRRPAHEKSDLNEARPLLQAIFLGMLLAAGLMTAAAIASPEEQKSSPAPTETVSQSAVQKTAPFPDMHQPY
ncbi:hypothetical protein [Labrenzia sp. 011]|uniref:hypothetical protein n=1 Tax=Labrenzia sp. 011 TaxID=2171494 RepID=UPI000D513131|nr:hypothetical protein [Labrenzia sp. 011]PVB59771.1 hypothetical protein DCO57_20440 [Labrenzia sp. 011]